MMRREDGRVLLELSEEGWQNLQIVLGFAMASAMAVNGGEFEAGDVQMVLRTINTVHEGDETFTPYEVLNT